MAYSKQSFVFGQVLTAAQMNTVEDNIEDSRLETSTRAIFNQTAAPTFWTKVTDSAVNDNALRVVNGTVGSGGTFDFTTIFANRTVSNESLSTAQLAAHGHGLKGEVDQVGATLTVWDHGSFVNADSQQTSGSAGSGSTHNHTLNTDVKYQDVIIATKD